MGFPTLLDAVDALNPEEREQLQQHLLELEAEQWDQALEATAMNIEIF